MTVPPGSPSKVQLRPVAKNEAGLRLDRWFQRHFPELGHGALQKLLRTGQVRIDGKRAEAKDRVEPGQSIRLPPGVTGAPPPKPRAIPTVPDKDAEEIRSLVIHKDDHAGYYPGGKELSLKLVYERKTARLLGAQGFGHAGVDKRIDVLATAMSGGITAPALADLELAYAPPFSSAKDPVNMLGYMAENLVSGDCETVEAGEVAGLLDDGWTLLDVRSEGENRRGTVDGAVLAPLDDLREMLPDLGPGPFVVTCQVGQRGHTATALLQDLGFSARNLDGGYLSWKAWRAAVARDASLLDDERVG